MNAAEKLDEDRPVIIITVYSRLKHIRQCLESLEECADVENYSIIIGSDAAVNGSHAKAVQELRKFLSLKSSSCRFKEMHLLFHEANLGQLGNLRRCHAFARSLDFKTFAYMEDDVVVGRYYLQYLHEGLSKYRHEKDVIAINGYLSPSQNAQVDKCFLFNEFCAYGYASWFEKWEKALESKRNTNYASKVIRDRALLKKYARKTSNTTSFPFLAENIYRAADIELGLMLDVEGLWVLRPPSSLTANRGLDGSGQRSGFNATLQTMQPYHDRVEVPAPRDAARIRLEDIQADIDIKRKVINWAVLAIYKYVPYGFNALQYLRAIKKSL